MEGRNGKIVAIVQARMSSVRFPGKVLRPLAGVPMLEHVCHAAMVVLPKECVVVATSNELSDDPIADYCIGKGIPLVRGSLDDVVDRLQSALRITNADAFFRICADSPFYDPEVMKIALDHYFSGDLDLVTNVNPRTFPKGRSVELARASTFLRLRSADLTAKEREHVFLHYYEKSNKYRVWNFESHLNDSDLNLCIDLPEEWERAERFLRDNPKPPFSFRVEELRPTFQSF